VEKTHDYAHDNPALVPSFLDMGDFDKDFSDAHGLWSLLTAIRQLEEAVSDTIMAAGSEAYHAALAVYHNVQAAAKQDIPGAKAIYENLKPHFSGGKKHGLVEGWGDKPEPKRNSPFPSEAPGASADTLFQSPPGLFRSSDTLNERRGHAFSVFVGSFLVFRHAQRRVRTRFFNVCRGFFNLSDIQRTSLMVLFQYLDVSGDPADNS
jgi:hypothetical protein